MKSLNEIVKNIPEETKKLIEKQGDIALLISKFLKKKGITQREFAARLAMKESRLSKILSGEVNLTLKTIVKLELALGEEIIRIPLVEDDFGTEQKTEIPTSYFDIEFYGKADDQILSLQEVYRVNIELENKMLEIKPKNKKSLAA